MLSGMSAAVYQGPYTTAAPTTASATINIVASTATSTDVFPNETNTITEWNAFGEVSTSLSTNAITEYSAQPYDFDQSTSATFRLERKSGSDDNDDVDNSIQDNNFSSTEPFRRSTDNPVRLFAQTNVHRNENVRIDHDAIAAATTVATTSTAMTIGIANATDKLTSNMATNMSGTVKNVKFVSSVSTATTKPPPPPPSSPSPPATSFITPINVPTENKRFRFNDFADTKRGTWSTNSTLIVANNENDDSNGTMLMAQVANGSIANVSTATLLPTIVHHMVDAPVRIVATMMPIKVKKIRNVDRPVKLLPPAMQIPAMKSTRLPATTSTAPSPLPFALHSARHDYNNNFSEENAITSASATTLPDTYHHRATTTDNVPTSSDYIDDDANLSTQYVYYGNSNEAAIANDFDDFYRTNDSSKSILALPRNGNNNHYNDVDDINNPIATDIVVAELKSSPIVISDTSASGAGGDSTIHWPVKKEAIMEGNLILGGLMMVHSREDTITCGPIMPQGGIQALEVMLFTLDRINEIGFLPNISLGAHILDDCDKDTYGLEMAVDFIKGKSLLATQFRPVSNCFIISIRLFH